MQGKSNRRGSQRNQRRARRSTKGQQKYIRNLRREAGRPPLKVYPKTWATAVKQIDRLLVELGREPNPRVKRPELPPLTNRQKVTVSIARDLAAATARESLADEQARLKLAAAARRARATEHAQHKPDSTSAAD